MKTQFQLISKSGITRGLVWALGEKPLLIGRDEDCDIMIVDPLVSRRHCKIQLLGNNVHVEDLGSRNTTLVNGAPTVRGLLRLGDEVAVGRVCLVLIHQEAAPEPVDDQTDNSTTVSIRQSEAFYISGSTTDFLAASRVHTVCDLADLYAVSRLFGYAENARDAARELGAWLQQRFKPSCLWIGMQATTGSEDIEYFVSPLEWQTPEEKGFGDLSRRSMMQFEGILSSALQTGREAAMVAPMVVGQQRVGLIALAGPVDGAYDEHDLQLLLAVANASAAWMLSFERLDELRRENESLRSITQGPTALLGVSDAMKAARRLVRKAAGCELSVLLLGETGCGKELAARLIHNLSERKQGPFVAINCAAISEQLLESELFGHEKGAFSGADHTKSGLLESGNGGTVLLDEIGELSSESQSKLLRVIETKTFRRVGGNQELRADFRLVCATNCDVRQAIQSGRFRADLYYRICGLEITLPSLRERPSDIPVLAKHFLEQTLQLLGRKPMEISPQAMATLLRQSWPGNVRELKAVIERAVVIADGACLDCGDFAGPAKCGFETPGDTLREVETVHIERMLRSCGGRVTEAAKRLGISRTALYEKMERYGLQRP